MASSLQGCENGGQALEFSWSLTLAMVVIFLLLVLVARLFFKLAKKMEELEKYKAVWQTVREAAHLQREQDPFLCELDGNQHRGEEAEEERPLVMDNEETTSEEPVNSTIETMMPEGDDADRMEEMNLRRHRILRSDAEHGAAEDNGSDAPRDDGHGDEPGRPADDEDEDLKKRPSLQERDIRDTSSLQWRKSAMWKIGQTFTMDMQWKVEKTLKLMNMEFLQRDQGQEHQMMMKYHNRRQCQNLL